MEDPKHYTVAVRLRGYNQTPESMADLVRRSLTTHPTLGARVDEVSAVEVAPFPHRDEVMGWHPDAGEGPGWHARPAVEGLRRWLRSGVSDEAQAFRDCLGDMRAAAQELERTAPAAEELRVLRVALRRATQAFERGDLLAFATANPSVQHLVDAAVAWGRKP